MQEEGVDMLGSKKMNYDFLMLVRDKKYPEALLLGKKILQFEPNNPSIKKFCDFILANDKKLAEMVAKEKQQEEYEEVDSDDEEESQSGDDEEKSSEEKSEESKESQEEEEEEQEAEKEKEKPQKKVQLTTCSLNQIPHICTRNHQ